MTKNVTTVSVCPEYTAPLVCPHYPTIVREKRRLVFLSPSSHHVDCFFIERAPVRVLGIVHQNL